MIEEKPFYYRKILVAVILLCITVAILLTRQVLYQNKHSNEATVSKGIDSVKAYERVILNHFPLSPYTKKAVNKLLEQCEVFKENDGKLYCYETLRSSLIQIRSFYQPYSEVIEKIKPKIAELRAKEKIAWEYNTLTMKDYDQIYSEQMVILNYDNAPSLFWSIVTVSSLLGWIGSIIIVIFKGLTKPVNKRWLTRGIALYFIFFFLWILSLCQA